MKNIGTIIVIIAAITAIIILGVVFVTKNGEKETVSSEGDSYLNDNISSGNDTESDVSTDGETGAFFGGSFAMDEYIVNIDSKQAGHPGPEAYYLTDISIENDEGTESDYDIYFSDIIDSDEKPYDSNFNVYEDGIVSINGKEYKYYIDSSGWSAILCYTIPNENKYLVIKVNGSDVFDSDGNQAKTLAVVDEDVFNSKELAEVLNFTVAKSEE